MLGADPLDWLESFDAVSSLLFPVNLYIYFRFFIKESDLCRSWLN